MARKERPQPIPARALVLSPPAAPGAEFLVKTALQIVMPDGTSIMGTPAWKHSWHYGVLRLGIWVPVLVPPDDPDSTELDTDRVPQPMEIAGAVVEALGGPAAITPPYDEWRVKLALDYAEHLIKEAAFSAEQAEAIRQRISAGI